PLAAGALPPGLREPGDPLLPPPEGRGDEDGVAQGVGAPGMGESAPQDDVFFGNAADPRKPAGAPPAGPQPAMMCGAGKCGGADEAGVVRGPAAASPPGLRGGGGSGGGVRRLAFDSSDSLLTGYRAGRATT